MTWRSIGGCGPFSGTVTARYSDQPAPYATYKISAQAGTLTDQPAAHACVSSYAIIYTLTLRDRSGQVVTASTSVQLFCIA